MVTLMCLKKRSVCCRCHVNTPCTAHSSSIPTLGFLSNSARCKLRGSSGHEERTLDYRTDEGIYNESFILLTLLKQDFVQCSENSTRYASPNAKACLTKTAQVLLIHKGDVMLRPIIIPHSFLVRLSWAVPCRAFAARAAASFVERALSSHPVAAAVLAPACAWPLRAACALRLGSAARAIPSPPSASARPLVAFRTWMLARDRRVSIVSMRLMAQKKASCDTLWRAKPDFLWTVEAVAEASPLRPFGSKAFEAEAAVEARRSLPTRTGIVRTQPQLLLLL